MKTKSHSKGVGLLLEILLKLAQNVSQISLTGSKVLFMTFHLKRTLLVATCQEGTPLSRIMFSQT